MLCVRFGANFSFLSMYQEELLSSFFFQKKKMENNILRLAFEDSDRGRGCCREWIYIYIYILMFLFSTFIFSLRFPFIFPHFLARQTPLSLLQWPTSSPTTRSPSSRRPSASSTRTAMVSLFRSLSLCFSLSLTLVLVFACFLDLIFAISL